jgi:hypothetical protein
MNDDQTARRSTSRRRRAWVGATVAAAAAISGTSAFVVTSTPAGAASTASAATATVQHRITVLRFAVRFSPFHLVDVPPSTPQGDPGIGDYVVFSDDLLNPKGHVVGTEGGSGLLTRISASGVQVFYDMAIGLAHGQIAVQGLASPAAHKRLAIVGGTGRYVGARGHIDLVENGDGTGSLVITLGA